MSRLLPLCLALALLPVACRAPRTSTVPRPALEEGQVGVELVVHGLTCPIRCPQEVKALLGAVPGVVSVTVDYADQSAYCVVRAGTDPDTVVAGLRPPYAGELLN